MLRNKLFSRIALAATLLALFVVVLGAYVRLSDAGLGCPDWPGCYGQLTVTQVEKDVSAAETAYPERKFEAPKAWKEMIHRYFASTLGLLILILAVMSWRRRSEPGQLVKLPLFLLVLVIFQGLLGMWTVTLLLKPVVVMGHLLGGMTTLALLWWLTLRSGHYLYPNRGITVERGLLPLAIIGLVVVAGQIALGGWTSANYAALSCPDFPACQMQWWPSMDFAEAFVMWRGTGVDYEGGVLENAARVAIHMSHRIGAVITLLYVGGLSLKLILSKSGLTVRGLGVLLLLVLLTQISLGIANVLLSLPLAVADAHNGVAALLLLVMVTLIHTLSVRKRT